jgi:anti-sigma factor RsiW
VSEMLNHPTQDRLEAYVERTLDSGDSAVVESHLATCTTCETEVAELRSLFQVLAALPELSPATGFADRVMRDVRVRHPVLDWVNEWIERLTPSTNRGWALASAVGAMPVLLTAALAWWVLSHPAVTGQELWLFATAQAAQALGTGWQLALSSFAGSALATWLAGLLELAESVGRGGLGLAAVMFATLTLGSVYVLYENLFRPNARRAQHASYSF